MKPNYDHDHEFRMIYSMIKVDDRLNFQPQIGDF